ncbi:YusW family protein [Salicibibacter kimchii]|uniref:PepSY domain-containing protein n=1 Tax=Salicibibacter kimchii TaxID=2099786 RepID=A0A345BZ54_9BACI|nr:YusW family protein [Salicibibacter kimchii]AXF56235.1 hypothetical protein DT065_09550 [Salicibibacter kimchii]
MKKFMIATGWVAAISLSAFGFSQFNASAGDDGQPKDGGEAPIVESTTEVEEATDESVTQVEEQTVQADENSESHWFESLPYKEFELEVEYGDDVDYEADYEYEGGDPEAEIEDERKDKEIEISGDKALNELSHILPNIDIDENTSKDEGINVALDAFNLDSNYKELEIEIEFLDGKEMEIEDE